MSNDSPHLRLGVFGIVTISLFAALFARLWYLQVMASPEFQLAAKANQQRVIIEPAPRGRIFDRDGVVLVDNRISIVVTADRSTLDDLDEGERARVLGRLAEELTRYGQASSVDVIENRLDDVRFSPYTPVPVAEDVPEELAVYLSEHNEEFTDAIEVEARPIRTYPYGRLASHLLGYTGAINDEEFTDAIEAGNAENYQLDDEVGKTGVERVYEADLRGTPGRRVLEVDAEGDTVRQLSYTRPVPGDDLQLTIDADLQAVAETALREELERTRTRRVSGNNPANAAPAGSTVVLDTRDGAVVAMASFPDYDPAAFTNGIDTAEYGALLDPAAFAPLNNRVIQGQYAPGSTFKLVTAYAAMTVGAITDATTIVDQGVYRIQNCSGACVKRNAGSKPYGVVDLRRALTVSSDVYFFGLGDRFWIERDTFGDPIQDAARAFGMGEDLGIPLPIEQSGHVPTADSRRQRNAANPEAFPNPDWRSGDNVNLAIGQGDMLVTPLQLANAYATLANGGTVYAPNVAARVLDRDSGDVLRSIDARVINTVPLPPEVRQPIVDGLTGAVNNVEEGTAAGSFLGFPDNFTVAGKTGTAQVAGKADTAVFVAFGPIESPRYVAAAMLEESGFGGIAAAPLVRRILEPLADPSLMRTVGPGGVLDAPLAAQADPFAAGDVTD